MINLRKKDTISESTQKEVKYACQLNYVFTQWKQRTPCEFYNVGDFLRYPGLRGILEVLNMLIMLVLSDEVSFRVVRERVLSKYGELK